MNAFNKTLGLATLALCSGTAVLSQLWPSLHVGFGLGGIALMAVNAYAAIAILNLRLGVDPIRLIMISMLARLGVVTAVMLAVIAFVDRGAGLYSFVFSAMAGFVVFQAVEVRHIVRNPGLIAQ